LVSITLVCFYTHQLILVNSLHSTFQFSLFTNTRPHTLKDVQAYTASQA
jgi:hypothetical protein